MNVTVMKLGGSVLVDLPSYKMQAAEIAGRLQRPPHHRLVIVVSAARGETDALLALGNGLCGSPDPVALHLLASTGELKSTALLTLCLCQVGVAAAALAVHQTGITYVGDGEVTVDVRPLRQALRRRRAAVVPGFVACDRAGNVTALGRGGSDLSAVVLAAALGAPQCELSKDVPGYFRADPKLVPSAEHLPVVDVGYAIELADAGCRLVQRSALCVAARAGLPLIIRAPGDSRYTYVKPCYSHTSSERGFDIKRRIDSCGRTLATGLE